MENNGYIKLYRKMLDNPIICKDSDYFTVWIYLLLNATHNEYDVIFKNQRITLSSGQLITGRKIIGEKFGIDENKVQRILKNLENQQQIEQQTSTKNRLITIVNWDKYQNERHQNEQQMNNNRTTSKQQMNTNKNDKNDKNEKNIRSSSSDNKEEHLQQLFVNCTSSTNLNAIEECISYLDDFPYEVIEVALKKTSEKNGGWKYAKTILQNWLKAGIKTIEQVQAEELRFKSNKNNDEEETKEERIKRLMEKAERAKKIYGG